jgi:hypothetical protein
MPRILLPVITSTTGHTVLKKPPGDTSPYHGRGGDIDLLCGACHHLLAEHSYSSESKNIVLCCPICGSFNLAGAPEPPGRGQPLDANWGRIRTRDLRRS